MKAPYTQLAGLSLFLSLAPLAASAQTIIGFESSEGYTADQTVVGQPSSSSFVWTAPVGTGTRSVVTSAPGIPTAPSGSNFLSLSQTASGNDFSTNLTFTDTPLTGDFSASALLAYSGTMDFGYVVFSSSSADFRGVQVGFMNDNGTMKFAYRNGETWTAFGAAVATPEVDTFYQFDVDISTSSFTYSLVISDLTGNEIASISSASIRGGISSFNLVALKTFNANVNEGNGLYTDDISIGVVPEPSESAAIGGLLAILLVLATRYKTKIHRTLRKFSLQTISFFLR